MLESSSCSPPEEQWTQKGGGFLDWSSGSTRSPISDFEFDVLLSALWEEMELDPGTPTCPGHAENVRVGGLFDETFDLRFDGGALPALRRLWRYDLNQVVAVLVGVVDGALEELSGDVSGIYEGKLLFHGSQAIACVRLDGGLLWQFVGPHGPIEEWLIDE